MATIVIEAPNRSGSLATARNALEQGREVLVLPGPANDFNYAGSHKLIRDGARLITCADDILEDLNLLSLKNQDNNARNIVNKYAIEEPTHLKIIGLLSSSSQALNIDKIIQLTKLDAQTANSAIAHLVISGVIKETETGYYI